MEIRTNEKDREVRFDTLKTGDTFLFGDTCGIVVEELTDCFGEISTAIDLKTGKGFFVDTDDTVLRLKAILTIESLV